jgi:plasmid maintenance system killer protein
MIRSFGNRLAGDVFNDRRAAAVRRLPPTLYETARRRVLYLHEAEELRDLRVPPGNRLEALGTTSKIWMNLQATWDLDVEAKRRHRAA